MELFKLTSLLSVLSLTWSKSAPLYNFENGQKSYSSIYDSNNVYPETKPNGLEQCFCMQKKPTDIPVSKLLNPHGNKLERLVVYLYKDPSSPEIKFYVPNKNKQVVIPDLAFDIGDDLKTLNGETVEYIFNEHPEELTLSLEHEEPDRAPISYSLDPYEKSPIHHHYHAHDAYDTDNKPFIMTFEKIPKYQKEMYNKDQSGHVHSHPSYESIPTQFDMNTDINNINPVNLHFVREKESKPKLLPENLNKIQFSKLLKPIHPELSTLDYTISPSGTFKETVSPIKTAFYPQETPISEHIVSAPLKPNPLSLHYLPQEGDISLLPEDVKNFQILEEFVPARPSTIKPNTYGYPGVHTYPAPKVKQYPDNDHINTINSNLYITFDKWFKQQMNRFHFEDSVSTNIIDIYTLKLLIEDTLHESGMYVSGEGLLTDSNGNALHMSNLKLRPILIGDSVEYQKLLKGKLQYKLPTDIPYLEAVLVVLVNPPKILGIIPLGKTYIPESYQKLASLRVNGEQNLKGCGGLCQIKNNYYHQGHYNSPYNVKYIDEPYQLKEVGPIYKKTFVSRVMVPTPAAHDTVSSSNDGRLKVMHEGTINTYGNDQLGSIQKYVNNYSELHNKELIREEATVTANPSINLNKTNEDKSVEYSDEDEKERPDFRIIGGNPATGSGTPVSNKGRSGALYDEDLSLE